MENNNKNENKENKKIKNDFPKGKIPVTITFFI